MTPAEAVLRVRSILDENGVTSGYYDNTLDIYKWIDSAKNEIIDTKVSIYRLMRSKIIDFEIPEVLKPLIKLDALNTTTVGPTLQEYALPSDYIETYWAEYDYAGGLIITRKVCTLLEFREIQYRQGNSYKVATADFPVYYIKAQKIGFYPQPIGAKANAYNHYYIYSPAEITSGTGAFVLGTETHELMVQYAVSQGLLKDGQIEAGIKLLNDFYIKANKI